MRLRNEIELENNSEKTNTKKNCIQLNLSLSTWAPHTHTQQSLGGGRTQPGRTQPPLYLVSLENITKVMSGEFNFLRFPFINAFYCKKKKNVDFSTIDAFKFQSVPLNFTRRFSTVLQVPVRHRESSCFTAMLDPFTHIAFEAHVRPRQGSA